MAELLHNPRQDHSQRLELRRYLYINALERMDTSITLQKRILKLYSPGLIFTCTNLERLRHRQDVILFDDEVINQFSDLLRTQDAKPHLKNVRRNKDSDKGFDKSITKGLIVGSVNNYDLSVSHCLYVFLENDKVTSKIAIEPLKYTNKFLKN